jgi:hypothetical protein
MTVTPGHLRHPSSPTVAISAHALGRWFQRSACRDFALLTEDLRALLNADPAADAIACARGHWRGAGSERVFDVYRSESLDARSVRTFIA